MKIYKILLVLFTCTILNHEAISQVNCASKIDLALIQQNNPARYQRILALEQHTQNYINSVNNGSNTARLTNPNSTIIIPVVVHVLHRGEALGVGRNISDAQIQSQIAVLNEDFRRLNADRVNTPNVFQPVASDPNFEFRLTCTDPNGIATNGITRTFANRNTFFPLQNLNSDGSINEQNTGIKFNSTGGRDAWPTDRYLNIWVCEMGNGLIGYGQFPDEYTVKANTDGVVMQFNAFGRVGTLQFGLDQGRVCVHEIGHWLNLRHVWGDANCGDDLVGDTPPQQTFNTGCPIFPRTSGCSGNGINGDMFMNYMDYTNNGCMNIYTRGQSLRMRATFAQGGPRAGFIDNYFNINPITTSICNPTTITARNLACLPVTWTVAGPLSIISGQGTSSINVQNGGDGIATITATAGGYTDTKTFVIGKGAASTNFTNLNVSCVYTSRWVPYFFGSCKEVPNALHYYWYAKDMSLASNPYVYKDDTYSIDFPLKNNRTYAMRLVTVTPCGDLTQEELVPVSITCSGSGTGARLAINPNPVTSTLNIESVKDIDALSNNDSDILDVIITDKLGNILIQKKFAAGNKMVSIPIISLHADVYFVKTFNGKTWTNLQFVKK